MKMLSVKVKKGRLDLPKGALQEGETVTLLVPEEGEQGFRLSEDLQQELQASLEEARRGETIDGRQLLDELER